jgi:hypothetical protein
VSVAGPNLYYRQLQATTKLDALPPGEYTVTAAAVETDVALYAPADAKRTFVVNAGSSDEVNVRYALAGGGVQFTIGGLPANVTPIVSITGNGFTRSIGSSGVVGGIPAGEYVVRIDSVVAPNGDKYASQTPLQTIVINRSTTPVPVAINYVPTTGALRIVVNGLFGADGGPITITGSNGFNRKLAATSEFRGLDPGLYTFVAEPVNVCPFVLRPDIEQTLIIVRPGMTSGTTVSYTQSSPPPQALNLQIADAQLVQVIQDSAGRIPIVAGRPALLRVFAVANQCNASTPRVRVTLTSGRTYVIEPATGSVPVRVSQFPTTMSWNAIIPAADVQPDFGFIAEVDPDNAVTETSENDNRLTFRADGRVVAVPPLNLTFVPITLNGGASTANVTAENAPQFLAAAREMFPVGTINTTIAPPLTSQVNYTGGGVAQISALLQEVELRRVIDGSSSNYLGIIRPPPGVVTLVAPGAMGLLGGKSLISNDITWFAPAGQRPHSEVLAHEMGHTFGRAHSPSCNAPAPDPRYPHSSGTIGIAGFDIWSAAATGTTNPAEFSPSVTDIMGYCYPAWISDYTYLGILAFRAAAAQASETDVRVPSIVVSGRVDASGMTLDPVFSVHTRPSLPRESGEYVLEGLDASRKRVFKISFTPLTLDHDPTTRYFAFAIPLAEIDARRLSSVALVARGRTVELARKGRAQSSTLTTDDIPVVAARSIGVGLIELTWDGDHWPALIVTDQNTGHALAIGRAGQAIVQARTSAINVLLSDGVQSRAGRVRF